MRLMFWRKKRTEEEKKSIENKTPEEQVIELKELIRNIMKGFSFVLVMLAIGKISVWVFPISYIRYIPDICFFLLVLGVYIINNKMEQKALEESKKKNEVEA